MRGIDFSSWQAVFSTVLGLVLVTLVMVSIRLMFMQTIQRRRERQNRQINERLRTLIAAYKTLGGGGRRADPADPGRGRGGALRHPAARHRGTGAARGAGGERPRGGPDRARRRARRLAARLHPRGARPRADARGDRAAAAGPAA